MIKRTLTIFFILLANIILLAHAVIPHHHHKSEVCVNTHKHADNVAHNNCIEHNHNNEKTGDDCELNQVVVICSHQIKHQVKGLNFADNQYQANLIDEDINTPFSQEVLIPKPPLLVPTYSLFAVSSIGLRAPPII